MMPKMRCVLTALNLLVGVALLAVSLNMQTAQVSAQGPGGCGTEDNPWCDGGEACCNGVCFDPTVSVCDCDGNLQPIEEEI